MSTWNHLCGTRENAKTHLKYMDDPGAAFWITVTEFDKIRAVVEAAESFNLCYRYCDKTDWIPTLNKMDEALKKLGVGE